ncbi:hypothetical protein ASG37_07500 [Sphingomonas sp. Leaf407]|uniref:DUF2339 domain-containing protein n=1 Tax=Sphingomonas sp. Leaf407 TaxID=1736369 RepID=UPI0006F9C1BA|nr:DUF2339 domain-containing protein [Sphingomonas sp. Leaf407]KQN39409.1 hypothetical protein ASE97_04790 [Sphingomonas sp. Leaf42]KQT28685.1 hypothetical protein ASG37_07500 [Sphingomonas sp. Leaf407]
MSELLSLLLLVLVAVLGVALLRLSRRVALLEAKLGLAPAPVVLPEPLPRPAPAARPEPRIEWPAPPRPKRPRPSIDLETLVGARLPVWIGGLALVVAGIFLVRLSIEAGWLTPAVRTLFAAGFALLLLAGAEGARRLPATRGDPRVGQVLAGAGIASAYATLYLAAALYHLVSPLTGFVVMLGVTALGLFLALRHGPPTAVMALIGGFAAPLVAGYDAAGIGPLLVYLGLFVAGLLGLASVRGWAWLAVTTLVTGFGWSALLIALLPTSDLAALGLFVVALGIGGALAAPRTGVTHRLLRAAPVVVALVQLLALAPALDFSALAWGFYLVLAAAALFLGHRDGALLPAGLAAAILVTLLVAAGLAAGSTTTPVALPVAILLFALSGGALSRRSAQWVMIALVGGIGPLLAAQLVDPGLLPPIGWAAAWGLLGAAGALLGQQHRDRRDAGDLGLVGGITTAALGLALALANLVPPAFAALAPLAALALLAAALPQDRGALARLAALPALALLALIAPTLTAIGHTIALAILYEALPYTTLPHASDALAHALLPALALLGLARWRRGLFGPVAAPILAAATAIAILGGYVLLKQPLAIATLPRFVGLGFVERAAITDLALVAGWLLWNRIPTLARALVALALARLVWFDLIGLNPAWIEQAVGPLPLFNAATLHLGLFALILWRLPGLPQRHLAAAALTLLAVLATIRQTTHGTRITGPVTSGENWGYSAAMLALAILWLWQGVTRDRRELRRFGLTLLTLTTLKVFLIDAAALGGIWRIVSFLGLGLALIAIGWGYRRFLTPADNAPPADPAPASAPAAPI